MQYRNLHDLVNHSSSSRHFYLSLPVELQLQICEHKDNIHSAFELREKVRLLESYNRAVLISKAFDRFFTE